MTIDDKPGFRRRFRIVPARGSVTAALEDDVHCMKVTMRHDGETITAVEADMMRSPWDSCPGAVGVVRQTFVGMKLTEATGRGGKRQNCTHLYDLAELGAAHAGDKGSTVYDILVSDPADGRVEAQLRLNGKTLLAWTIQDDVLVAPEALAGCPLFTLRERIGELTGPEREAARILQWGSMVAHGRRIPWEDQADAPNLPSNCYTLQPERASTAKRIGERFDFSAGGREPLEGIG